MIRRRVDRYIFAGNVLYSFAFRIKLKFLLKLAAKLPCRMIVYTTLKSVHRYGSSSDAGEYIAYRHIVTINIVMSDVNAQLCVGPI